MARLLMLATFLVVGASSSRLGDRLTLNFPANVPTPLTEADALSQGWVQLGGAGTCDTYYGKRFRQGTRKSPTAMYNNMGDLAGYQFVVNTKDFAAWPLSNRAELYWMIERDPQDGKEVASISIYVKDPKLLCTAVEAAQPGSIGDRAWVRRSSSHNLIGDFDVLPLDEKEVDVDEGWWFKGGCVPSGMFSAAVGITAGMGKHYWAGTCAEDVGLSTAAPLFLVYEKGTLIGIGMNYVAQDGKSPNPQGDPPELWEFPVTATAAPSFLPSNFPTCIADMNTGTKTISVSLHSFFVDGEAITCEPAGPPTCKFSSDCSPDEYCSPNGGHCQPKAGEAQRCNAVMSCLPGMVCTKGRCAPVCA